MILTKYVTRRIENDPKLDRRKAAKKKKKKKMKRFLKDFNIPFDF